MRTVARNPDQDHAFHLLPNWVQAPDRGSCHNVIDEVLECCRNDPGLTSTSGVDEALKALPMSDVRHSGECEPVLAMAQVQLTTFANASLLLEAGGL